MSSLPRFNLFVLLLGAWLLHGCKCQGSSSAPAPSIKPNKDYQLNWKTLNLQGKVKSIQELDYEQHIPDSELQYFVTRENFWFDPQGNVTRRTTFVQQGRFHADHHYKYDAAGNYVALENHDEGGKVKSSQRNTFDAEGNLLESVELDDSQQVRKRSAFTWQKSTSDGHTDETKVAESGLKVVTRFDPQGRMLHRIVLAPGVQAAFSSKTVYTHDPSGNVVEEVEYKLGKEDRFSNKRLSTYDASNLLTGLTFVDNDNPSRGFERTVKYDQYGNITENVFKIGQMVDTKRSYQNQYEYDATGNWIRRVTFKVNGEPKSSVRRQIEYY